MRLGESTPSRRDAAHVAVIRLRPRDHARQRGDIDGDVVRPRLEQCVVVLFVRVVVVEDGRARPEQLLQPRSSSGDRQARA